MNITNIVIFGFQNEQVQYKSLELQMSQVYKFHYQKFIFSTELMYD